MIKRWRVLPILLLGIGLWLLAGCFYLPLPEHVTGHQKDFRKAVGDANSKRPLQVGVATREQVIALLGQPPFYSHDGRSIAYALTTEGGAWVYPLCFDAEGTHQRVYAIRLDFDAANMLTSWDTARGDVTGQGFSFAPSVVTHNLMVNLSLPGSELRARPWTPPGPATRGS